MSNKNYFLLSAIALTLAALLHLVRVILGWDMVINGHLVPRWLSVVAAIVAGLLAYIGFKASNKEVSAS